MSTPLWNKKLKCPFCQTEFETTRLRSSVIRVKIKQTDFGNVYEGECAYFYAVTACPECTFAALNKDFEETQAGYEPKILEATKQIRKSLKVKPDIFKPGSLSPEAAVKRHELAIAFAKMKKHKNLASMAVLRLHVVWILRLMGETEKEKAALAEAAAAYEEYFDKGGDLPEQLGEPGVLYLIGELHRRQGNYQEARRFYERSITSKEIKSFPRIAEMARDMMLAAKEQMGATKEN